MSFTLLTRSASKATDQPAAVERESTPGGRALARKAAMIAAIGLLAYLAYRRSSEEVRPTETVRNRVLASGGRPATGEEAVTDEDPTDETTDSDEGDLPDELAGDEVAGTTDANGEPTEPGTTDADEDVSEETGTVEHDTGYEGMGQNDTATIDPESRESEPTGSGQEDVAGGEPERETAPDEGSNDEDAAGGDTEGGDAANEDAN
ncbi:hypothetical protein [Halorientalis halophila]|uniref:hypothetical protein n=1 Tax=Halorientalis halophila TaxID=3108499 RepID=UPI003008D4FE